MKQENPAFTFAHEFLPDGVCRIRAGGNLSIQAGHAPFAAAEDIVENVIGKTGCDKLVLDLKDVHYMDSTGITLIAYLKHLADCKHLYFQLNNIDPNIQDLLAMLNIDTLADTLHEKFVPKKSILNSLAFFFTDKFSYVGELYISLYKKFYFTFYFVGDTILTLLSAIRRPQTIRLNDTMKCLERNGFDSLPVVALLNFLVGIVLAYQAAIQLRQFGANIYVADLVALAQTREFGPMITAIILVGRSGSAFAAEIGSMKVNEEIDALVTMGISHMRFLVAPKIIAMLIAMPLLTLVADAVGIAGGLFVGITSLDLTVQGFLLETRKAIGLFDVFSGVIKSIAFAFIISLIGCLRGFEVKGGADSVGQAATSAVVSGIFMVLVADAIFTVIFQYV